MKPYHKITIPAHEFSLFQAITRESSGYISSISDHNFPNFCYIKVPIIFASICYGSGHRHNVAYSAWEWLSALRACSILNEELAQGKRDWTDDSVKRRYDKENNCKFFREYRDILDMGKKLAEASVKETNSPYYLWTRLVDDGVEFHVLPQNIPAGSRSEIQANYHPYSCV